MRSVIVRTTPDIESLPLSGGTLTGYLTLNGAPVDPLQAATKGYVDGKTLGLVTTAQLNDAVLGLASEDYVNNAVSDKITTAQLNSAVGDKVTQSDIDNSLNNADFVNSTYVDNAIAGIGDDVPQNKIIDESSSNPDILYVGVSASGTATNAPLWSIHQVDASSDPISILYADGVSDYTKVWDDRESYTYTPTGA